MDGKLRLFDLRDEAIATWMVDHVKDVSVYTVIPMGRKSAWVMADQQPGQTYRRVWQFKYTELGWVYWGWEV